MANLRGLFNWGPLQFEVFPLSLNEVTHTTGTDWAKKEIAGAAYYREWVGEGDEEIQLKGKLYPHFFAKAARERGKASSGGMAELDALDNMRRLGHAHALVRGDGWMFGWYVVERLSRAHSFLAQDGIGQQVIFEAMFVRVPVPQDPSDYFPTILQQT
ncbi:MAG: tail protein [Candidatus Saccharibacteria bacterium]|nr:tail protein [Candidatus Saccharibacteria bacterium]